MKVIITCEHGGNSVPFRYRELFRGRETLLNSHRGYDRHALSCAKLLARKLGARLFCSTVTRLLIDLNRSPHNRRLFSELSGGLNSSEKEGIIQKYYLPYRRDVEAQIRTAVSKGKSVLHISVHSFAPVIKGMTKKADIGILYDPSRALEKIISVQWQKSLRAKSPALNVRRNYPYLGRADGLITYLRKRFNTELYTGIELELNQRLLRRYEKRSFMFCDLLIAGLNRDVRI